MDQIPFDELEVRGVYVLRSRNLRVGVWTGAGFIGIREKLGSRYLFTEYPNTARAIVRIDEELDERIQLRESYEPYCFWCGWPVDFSTDREPRWQHLEERGCVEAWPTGRTYAPLFDFLDELERPDGSAFRL